MVTTTTYPGLVSIDPIQGLIDYVQDIKPYHTKVFETLVEYVYTDMINVKITDVADFGGDIVFSAINVSPGQYWYNPCTNILYIRSQTNTWIVVPSPIIVSIPQPVSPVQGTLWYKPAQVATFEGSISGTALTISFVTSGTIVDGMYITPDLYSPPTIEVVSDTIIISGSGLLWTLNTSNNVPTTSFTATNPASLEIYNSTTMSWQPYSAVVSCSDITQGDIDVTFTETSITEALEFFMTPPGPNPPATIVAADSISGVIYFTAAGGSPSINLNTAVTYAVLASSTITNTGFSVLTGDLGLYPGVSVTGFPPGIVTGTQHITDAAAQQAELDALAAYTAGQALTPFVTIPAQLGGTTITPGIYQFTGGAADIATTTTVTLNAGGNPNAIFVFQIASTLTANVSSVVLLANGAQAKNVYWFVGSSATIGVSSTFKGTVIAQASITVNTSASVVGHLFALTAAVTFDDNAVTATPAGSGPSPPATVSVQAGDILNITGSSGNDGNYDVLSVGYDSVTNEIAVTLNMVPVTNPSPEGTATFFHTDTTYSFQLSILSIGVTPVNITDPASGEVIMASGGTIIIVAGNATRAIQPGSIFRIQSDSLQPLNNSSPENTYPITSVYYAIFDNFIPGINPNGSRNPLLDTTIIGVGIPPGSPITAPFILPTNQGASGYIVPYNITGYDDRYDAPYDGMAGYHIILD